MAYTLSYCLNLPSESDKRNTHIGSAVHLVLESCAYAQLNKQNGKSEYVDDNFGPQSVDLNVDLICDLAYKKIKRENFPSLDLDDKEEIHRLARIPLEWTNPVGKKLFNPFECKIVQPEQYFDIALEQDQFRYSYKLNGQTIEDFLHIKGTIDLIVEEEPGHLHLYDWKTGARKNWNKKWAPRKTYEDLESDHQLRMYWYAARILYPHVKTITVTIFYLKEGPETICYSDEDKEDIEKMIKRRFDWIKNTQKPTLIYPESRCSWCHFFSHDLDNNPVSDYSESSCKFLSDQIQEIGLSKVTEKYMKKSNYVGGGQTLTKE